MIRIFAKFVSCCALLAAAVSVCAAAGGPSVSGVVRDSQGTPQVGALVELLRPNATVAASVFTDDRGRFSMRAILPGNYSLRAAGTSFLPTLRQNLSIRTHTVVDLTLMTIFEAAQWLPAHRRSQMDGSDDWAWTLRSSANRPLLRMLADGPVVVADGPAGEGVTEQHPLPLRGRVTAAASGREFGEGGLRSTVELAAAGRSQRAWLIRAGYGTDGGAGMDSLLGYRQQLGMGRTVRTVAAIADRPGITGGGIGRGLAALTLRSSESMLVAPGASLEFGNEEVLVRSADLLAEAHPFAVLSLDRGGLTLAYALATSPGMDSAEQAAQEGRLMPAAVERRGKVALEHGLHQQVSLKRETARGELTLIAFADDIRNPALNGWGSLDEADAERGDLLVDAGDRAFRGTGPDFRSVGFAAVLHRHLPGGWVTVSVANGSTLALGAQPAEGTTPAAVAAGARPARATLATASVETALPLTRTRVRGGYRWQPAASVTSVAPYQAEEISPYLSLCVRQPLHGRAAANGLEATIEARNLLAQGYRAFLTSDGSTVFFAQADRSIRGSLAFTF